MSTITDVLRGTAQRVRRAIRWAAVVAHTRATMLRSESGQTVAEYALVLLVAAAVAAAFLLWARQSGQLDSFFDAVFARLLESVEPEPTPAP